MNKGNADGMLQGISGQCQPSKKRLISLRFLEDIDVSVKEEKRKKKKFPGQK